MLTHKKLRYPASNLGTVQYYTFSSFDISKYFYHSAALCSHAYQSFESQLKPQQATQAARTTLNTEHFASFTLLNSAHLSVSHQVCKSLLNIIVGLLQGANGPFLAEPHSHQLAYSLLRGHYTGWCLQQHSSSKHLSQYCPANGS